MDTKRIRWEDDPAAGEARGYVGSLDTPVFRLWVPDGDGDRVLFAFVAGALGDAYHGTDEDEQKDKAERLLEEFASSLGAVFPVPGEALVAIEEEERPAAFFDEHDLAAIEAAGNWHDGWAEDSRDGDGNLILRYEPTGGLYRVLPIEET